MGSFVDNTINDNDRLLHRKGEQLHHAVQRFHVNQAGEKKECRSVSIGL